MDYSKIFANPDVLVAFLSLPVEKQDEFLRLMSEHIDIGFTMVCNLAEKGND